MIPVTIGAHRPCKTSIRSDNGICICDHLRHLAFHVVRGEVNETNCIDSGGVTHRQSRHGGVGPFPGRFPVPDKAFSAHKAFDYARKGGRSVEIASLTTATTRAWANPDGRATAELSAAPVRMKRAGEWVDFDLTLSQRPDGSIASNVHPHDLALSGAKGAGEHDLATVDVGGERLGLRWLGSLPQPTLSGSKATYSEVAPGIDLIVEARMSGFEQFLVVEERAAAARVAGLRQHAHRFGRFDAATGVWHSPQGKALARMPAAVMWDAQGFGPDGERRRRAKVGLKGTVVAPDLAWMLDAATQYPVTIDPGLDVDPTAGFDEFVQNTINITTTRQRRAEAGLRDSSDCLAVSWQGCRARSYIRFDGLTPFAERRFIRRGCSCGPAFLVLLGLWLAGHAHGYVWTERAMGIRAGLARVRPGHHRNPGLRRLMRRRLGVHGRCPVARRRLRDSQDSLSLALHADGDNDRDSWPSISHDSWKKFDSNETGNGPRISLTYNHIPRAVNPELEQDGSCGAGATARKYLATTEPTFRARVDDADSGNNVQIEVEVTPAGVPRCRCAVHSVAPRAASSVSSGPGWISPKCTTGGSDRSTSAPATARSWTTASGRRCASSPLTPPPSSFRR